MAPVFQQPTPRERAELVIRRLWGSGLDAHIWLENIHRAIIEATNAEVEKRRAAEAECARLRRIVEALSRVEMPVPFVIDAGENHLRLTVTNPVTGDNWECSFTRAGEVGHGR